MNEQQKYRIKQDMDRMQAIAECLEGKGKKEYEAQIYRRALINLETVHVAT